MGYDTDLNNEQWAVLKPLFEKPYTTGRKRKHKTREILNAIHYVLKTGCQWRLLPKDFPPYTTVFKQFTTWRKNGVWEHALRMLHALARSLDHRNVQPSVGIIDSQTVKSASKKGPRGYDAGKKIKGRKRHINVDVLGIPMAVVVTPADVQDRDGAKLVIERTKRFYRFLKRAFADGGYAGELVKWFRKSAGIALEIVKRSDKAKGFVVLPKRWIVERSFGWSDNNRRLSKDYEEHCSTSEAWFQASFCFFVVNRLFSYI
ncbi:IS5 family transposase [Rhodomicrobium sp. Az07]|uniref:IS5 family transposase n=1 Tax=Rhodomicrobium sp. Az07 TaxID=2839034 RepID=UPI001BE5FBD4|nr:IS5 family transposase [Rhodomicrobium sp. Az07]MBT3071406.1 IS5 family transposase [Rhodomicrobium sp. Az07]